MLERITASSEICIGHVYNLQYRNFNWNIFIVTNNDKLNWSEIMKWFRYLEITGWIALIIFFINMSMTNHSSGIVIYKGFIPHPWEVLFPLIWLIFCLIGLGAEIENGIKRKKNPTKIEGVEK